MAQLVGKRYANALFELALEKNLIDEYFEQSKFILTAFENNPDFAKIIEHPHVASNEKMKFVEDVFKSTELSDDLFGLLSLIFKKNREEEIKPLFKSFIEKVELYKGVTEATLYSAVPLSAKQINAVQTKLSQKLNKQVNVVTVVDPVYVGGLCVKVDGRIMDCTVKTQLDDMKIQLLNAQLA